MATGSDEVYESENRSTHQPNWLVGARTTGDAENDPEIVPSIVGLADAEQNVGSDYITFTTLGNSDLYEEELHWQTLIVSRLEYEELLNEAIGRQAETPTDEIDDAADVVQLVNQLYAMDGVTFTHVNTISIGEY